MSETGVVSVQDRVIEIFAEQALMDKSEVSPGASLEDLGIDSLGLVEIVFAIEECFDIQVPFNANEPQSSEFDVTDISSIVRGVEVLIAAKN